MWIFGYGSLMWDGWETEWTCLRRAMATLPGHRRTFSKASVTNWGTKEVPCPTLNLELDASGTCIGMAFEFSDDQEQQVVRFLENREGKNFLLEKHQIRLEDNTEIQARIPIYRGKNLLPATAQKPVLARGAAGRSGLCLDYVKGIAEKLAELGIADPVVTEFWREIQQR
jgi:cation transport protein ChaC